MSNQRPQGEENFEQHSFNYQKYLPQNYNQQNPQSNFADLDSQMSQQFQERFDIQSNVDTFRNTNMAVPSKQGPMPDNKYASSNFYNQFPQISQPQQVRNPLDNLQNTFNKFQNTKDAFTSQQDFSQFNTQPSKTLMNPSIDFYNKPIMEGMQGIPNQQQQQLLFLEFMRQQSNQNQILSGGQSAPMFGAGFLGAAQLLASTQQNTISPALSHQPSLSQIDPKNMPIQQKQPMVPEQNMAFMQELNKLYSQVNNYQVQIDAIEKRAPSNMTNNQGNPQYNTVSGLTPSQRNPISNSQQPFLNQQFQTLEQQTRSNSNIQTRFQEPNDPNQSSFAYKNNYIQETPSAKQATNQNIYNVDSFAKEKPYNPIQYQQFQENNTTKNNPVKYDDYYNQDKNQKSRQSNKFDKDSSPSSSAAYKFGEDPEQQNNLQNTQSRGFYNNNKDHYSPESNYQFGDEENNASTSQSFIKKGKVPVNIDDIPITSTKAKTFEELLESNLKSMQGEDSSQYKMSERNEKKDFLKKKSGKVNIPAGPIKKYNYYVENFEEGQKHVHPEPSASTYKEPTIQHYEVQKPQQNQKQQQQQQQQQLQLQEQENDKQDQEKSKTKKPFLSRGSGTAGGRKGLENKTYKGQEIKKESQNRNSSSTPVQRQSTQSNNRVLNDEDVSQFNNINERVSSKSPRPTTAENPNITKTVSLGYQTQTSNTLNQNTKKIDMTRSSIVEFEKLEQECITKYSPNKMLTKKPQQQQQNKKKKKLFDSDSEEEEEPEEDHNNDQINTEQQEQYKTKDMNPLDSNMNNDTEVPKSDVVKKFFYKQDTSKKSQPAKSTPGQESSIMSEEIEKMLKEKVEQLNKAIESVNFEKDKVEKMKRENEQLKAKLRVELRDLEQKKKKDIDDIEKLKMDEQEKLKKEKKLLEQRSKNLQLVNTSNKKEREEIDFLKKELQRVQEESKAKEQKQKSTIERLKKQVEEINVRNKELNDELKHLEQLRLQGAQPTQKSKDQQKPQQQQQQTQQPRYTFSNQEAKEDSNKLKSILKNNQSKEETSPLRQDDQYQDLHQEDEEYVDEAEDADYQEQYQESQKQKQTQQQHQQQQQPKINTTQPQVQIQQKQSSKPPVEEEQKSDIAEDEEEDYDMKFPKEYHNKNPSNMKVIEQIIGNDGKIQRVYENGKKEVIFNNGVKREAFPDGYTIVYFNNNDIKQTYSDQKVVYYFAEAKTTQTTYPDGLQVFKFANNQIEKHFPDGTKEIIFPDGTIKCIFADGEEESIFPDGTIQRIEKNGIKAIEFANGQKDIFFPDKTRIREYPDGKIRKEYPDGTYEITYRK